MDLSPRKVFTDLMHNLHDLSLLFDSKSEVKCLSNLETDILTSFFQNLSLTFKLGYSIDSLSSTKLHSHLSLLLELSTDLLSGNDTGNYLEHFLTCVLNIFRLMFKIGFYGNACALRNNNKDICKIRNLLSKSIQINFSIKHCENLYRKYLLPIFFNFIFFTDEWIDKFNRILPEPFFLFNHQSSMECNEHNTENTDLTIPFVYEYSKTDFDTEKDPLNITDESDSGPTVLFVPFQLKSIALRTVRNLLIASLGKDGFYNFYSDSILPSQLCDDIRFIEQSRARIYCENLSVMLELCPHKLADVISQQF